MRRTLLKSRIHRPTATHCEGPCAIDENLLDAANLVENKQVHLWNINNGKRFHHLPHQRQARQRHGFRQRLGCAPRCGGRLLTIPVFAQVPDAEVAAHRPQLVFVDARNSQTGLRDYVPTQAL